MWTPNLFKYMCVQFIHDLESSTFDVNIEETVLGMIVCT